VPSSWLLEDGEGAGHGHDGEDESVAILEVAQAGIVSGGSALTISLTHDRFRAERLAPGEADASAVLQFVSGLAAYPHEEESGWEALVRPALSQAHLQLVGNTSLRLTLPPFERYASP
jgi:hypothetical protein